MAVPRSNVNRPTADVDTRIRLSDVDAVSADIDPVRADVERIDVDVDLAYVAVGCNRVTHTLSWSSVSGLVAFGAHNAVAIYDPEAARIIATLRGHKDRTNAVEWVRPHGHGFSAEDEVVVSGSADGALIFWTRDAGVNKWCRLAEIPHAHSKGVTCLTGLAGLPFKSFSASCAASEVGRSGCEDYNGKTGASSADVKQRIGGSFDRRSRTILVISASSDSTVRIWQLDRQLPGPPGSGSASAAVTLLQTLPIGAKAVQSIALGVLPTETCESLVPAETCESLVDGCQSDIAAQSRTLLLVAGGLDSHVHLYEASLQELQFREVCVLRGHQDWVRSVDLSIPASANNFGSDEDIVSAAPILVASASQDKNIRVWRIAPRGNEESGGGEYDGGRWESSLAMYASGPMFKMGGRLWQASLESLLVGHEDWVLIVEWQRTPPKVHSSVKNQAAITSGLRGGGGGGGGENIAKPQSQAQKQSDRTALLSVSIDRTMMIWRPDPASGLWMNEVTVGELGPSNLGFFGGALSPQGDAILAHGYGGSLHLWKNINGKAGEDKWVPQLVPSGHFGPVADLCWDKTNSFLATAGKDQTVRIVAQWDDPMAQQHDNGNGMEAEANLVPVQKKTSARHSWHEIARTQVHGHDMNCVAWISGPGSHRYVSGADEKVLRVFEAPETFLDSLASTTASRFLSDVKGSGLRALGANMSALGLSQKPIYTMPGSEAPASGTGGDAECGGGNDMMDPLPEALPSMLKSPPLEEHLAQNTLWPETHKLYGHGNDVFCICSDHCGRFIATACKAQSAQAAEVWLWDTETWRSVAQLRAHSLTVTQMEFSHSDKYLLCVSRDRQLSVFEHKNQQGFDSAGGGGQACLKPQFELVAQTKAHGRIVWSASWTRCDSFFATGSRDKLVKIWRIKGEDPSSQKIECVSTLPPFASGVTAVAWSPTATRRHTLSESDARYFQHELLAVGLESGDVQIWAGYSDASKGCVNLTLACQVDSFSCHVAAVQRLRWREEKPERDDREDMPLTIKSGSMPPTLQLASCGADHALRLFSVQVFCRSEDAAIRV